jgi:catechol 2,3-dioxygenase-like lactoylglutathione lyase family enzyme
MQPRINVLTLAVNDLEKAHAFYRDGLGLPSQGILGTEFKGDEKTPAGAVAFFELQGGLIFALYPRTELSKDAARPVGTPNATEFSIGYAVSSKEKVDALLQQAEKAGAVVTESPHDRPWGIYSGYFQDLDGHLWEVIWNPGLPVND